MPAATSGIGSEDLQGVLVNSVRNQPGEWRGMRKDDDYRYRSGDPVSSPSHSWQRAARLYRVRNMHRITACPGRFIRGHLSMAAGFQPGAMNLVLKKT
jgi:hypothetical protein